MAKETGNRIKLEPTRSGFRKLLAANPNYFGTSPNLGLKAVNAMAGNTSYEEVECVSYSPSRDRIEATIHVKRSYGYSGGPCSAGSFEYVRFYIDYGGGWEDAGLAAVNVHDIPDGEDCRGDANHPISYVCGVDHAPRRKYCGSPVLPAIRAILSWNLVPSPADPDWQPPWGNVHDCRAQISPRRFWIKDILDKFPAELVASVPEYVLENPPFPDPDPGPLKPIALDALAIHYKGKDVPTHRFAFNALTLAAEPGADLAAFAGNANLAKEAGFDLGDVLKKIEEDDSGNTTYEELECLGLDGGLESLVATFKVKLSSGYSGPPCSAGSTEYVAFWSDWGNDECKLEYLDTVKTTVHDYEKIDDGICYAAILKVDLGKFRRSCEKPFLPRVRAVLSWNSPPSTTDPDDVPFWGNRVDRHVQIEPGVAYDGTARFTKVGGVAANMVDLGTGLTLPGAVITPSTTPLPNNCPFYGEIELRGPLDPALAGHPYRIRAANVDAGGSHYLTTPFSTEDSNGDPVTVTPDPINGWVTWPTWMSNAEGILGRNTPGTENRWDFTLEFDVAGNVVDTARTQMDNTVKNVAELTDTVNAGDLELVTAGPCKVPHGLLELVYIARDKHFLNWSIVVLGGPGGAPLPPSLSGTSQTPFTGTTAFLDFSDPMIAPCGYVVRLTITDRAIVNSKSLGHHTTVDRGLCLE